MLLLERKKVKTFVRHLAGGRGQIHQQHQLWLETIQTQPEVCANIRPNDHPLINLPGLDDTGVSESDSAEAHAASGSWA